jgi:hypothetical protein
VPQEEDGYHVYAPYLPGSHTQGDTFLTVPLYRELKRGTLSGLLADADLDTVDLRRLL